MRSYDSLKAWFTMANVRMEKKLIVVFIFLLIIPISITGYISYQQYSNSIKENTTNYVSEVSIKMLNKLEDYIEDIKRVSMIPLYSTEIQQSLENRNIDLENQRKIDYFIDMINNMKKDTNSVYIFDDFGNFFYNIKSDGIRKDVQKRVEVWRELARNANGKPVLISTQEVSGNPSSSKYLFTVVREILSTITLKPIGMIAVDAKISVIENAVKELDAVTKGKTLIVDEKNNVIYDSDKLLLTKNISDHESVKRAVGSHGNFSIVIDGKPYICAYTQSAKIGWKMLVFIPTLELTKTADIIRNVTIIASCIIIGFALIISIIVSFAITKPLRKLTFLMKEIHEGNLDVSIDIKYKDEVGILGNQFNRVIKKINELIKEIYTIQYRKQEAELRALQSQINPHFIYNTLETIRMTAVIHDDDEISEMTFVLGKLLRYSINRENEMVTVHQEMEHLRNYMILQNYRNANRFEIDIFILEELHNYQMIKLIFQPIVENAIFHGLDEIEGKIRIAISSSIEGNIVIYKIKDNGVGMEPDTMQKLIENMNIDVMNSDLKSGIGLRNVNERIKLYYGEQYGLYLDSKLGQGTEVMLHLPYQSPNSMEEKAC